jgi:lambda family phage minor tail protein L
MPTYNLSEIAIKEKNKLGTDSFFMIMLEILIPATAPVYITSNSEIVTWRGNQWQPFPFNIGERSESSKGEVPQVELNISNHSRVIERYLNMYDIYLKTNGVEGNQIKCNLYVVNSKDLANTEPIRSEYLELLSPKTDKDWATFTLGADNPFNVICPKRKLIKNFCYWKYKGVECGYTGTLGVCNKSLQECRERNNSARFGGFAGVGFGAIRL